MAEGFKKPFSGKPRSSFAPKTQPADTEKKGGKPTAIAKMDLGLKNDEGKIKLTRVGACWIRETPSDGGLIGSVVLDVPEDGVVDLSPFKVLNEKTGRYEIRIALLKNDYDEKFGDRK